MNHKDLLKEMRDSVGQKDPVVFFEKMVSVFEAMFDKLDNLEADMERVKTNSALAIQWEPKVASEMIIKQTDILRQDKDTYHAEISALKAAYATGTVVLTYDRFCNFWLDTLGWHPFLDYDRP